MSESSDTPSPSEKTIETFIKRWKDSAASERGNAQPFIIQLCREVLGVEPPGPASARVEENAYVFERRVDFNSGGESGGRRSSGFIDCYKSGCFVLEAKQGAGAPQETQAEALGGASPTRKRGTARRGTRSWQRAMEGAKNQAHRYARALPPGEGWPPFLVALDVGYCIDLYADFSRQGKAYLPFPESESFRIRLEDLRDPKIRERLRKVFEAPLELDPARRSARVTRQLAERLGKLAEQLESSGHGPDDVSPFLMRCLFTMFAEDVGLLPERSFTGLLEKVQGQVEAFPKALESLWQAMNEGGYEAGLMVDVRRFNGRLFADASALSIRPAQLDLLVEAARADWADVEPAIFGTLLERALDPRERHRLGAHYTPRAYVERLAVPTVIEPLREEWNAAQTAAAALDEAGEPEEAAKEIQKFHRRLCTVKVLDPACGSGNFLYVTLEHLKRLEAEVLTVLEGYEVQGVLDMTGGYRVTPEQLMGIEVNPRAAAITDVVLWIGYLQWHFRTYGSAERLDDPILKDVRTVECRDAVLDYDDKKPRMDEEGDPVTRWDGRTFKEHPTTGEMVPDESAQVPIYDYSNPRPAKWPEADFIVGNPPFIGNKRMRDALGDGYTEAVRSAYLYKVPKSADYVMLWWYKAAKAARKGLDGWKKPAERFGFVTTNSITQSFNRKVVDKQVKGSPPIALAFAIPDHPWIASADGSDVRIAMTVGAVKNQSGTLQTVAREEESSGTHWDVELSERQGNILPDLTIGADVAGAESLEANDNLSYRGMTLVGSGFVLEADEARCLKDSSDLNRQYVKPYMRGRDIVQTPSNDYVIDLYGLSADEAREKVPELYQIVRERVKPFREQNNRKSYRENWWIFGEARSTLRHAIDNLERYIATPRTAKHRVFTFLPTQTVPESEVVAFALNDSYHLGILSSRIHITWALAAGGKMGVGNDPRYNNTDSFDPFPFPATSDEQKARIRELGEQLDRHRKERLDAHDDLTMTGLYNVLEKERAGETLSEEEREIHQQGLVGVLREIHDELDAAVAKAYGWDPGLPEERILEKLVALNKKRRAEEEQGHVRYLRPEYQAPEEVLAQGALELDVDIEEDGAPAERIQWPETLAERAQAVHRIVRSAEEPLTTEAIARHFHYGRRKQVGQLLETLAGLGFVRVEGEELYAG